MDENVDYLADIPSEYAFYLNSGSYVTNLKQLSKTLKDMNENTFKFHVNADKNDFYNWIKACVKDEKLANSVKYAMDIKVFSRRLDSRINELSVKKEPTQETHQIVVKKENGCISVKSVKKHGNSEK